MLSRVFGVEEITFGKAPTEESIVATLLVESAKISSVDGLKQIAKRWGACGTRLNQMRDKRAILRATVRKVAA